MFVADKQETYKAYHVLITTNDIAFDNTSKNCNFYNLNTNFNGYITVVNVKKEITDFNTVLAKDILPIAKTSKLALAPTTTCVILVENFDDGSTTFIASLGCFGGGGGGIPSTGYAGTPGKGTADPVLPATDQWIDNPNNLNKLCGSYNFSTIGNASYANISGLGMSAKNGVIVVFAEFSAPICVAIPNYSGISPTIIFNQAWNKTMSEVMLELNNYSTLSVTSELIKGLIKTTLLVNLNSIQKGSSLNVIGCAGVSTTKATYCP